MQKSNVQKTTESLSGSESPFLMSGVATLMDISVAAKDRYEAALRSFFQCQLNYMCVLVANKSRTQAFVDLNFDDDGQQHGGALECITVLASQAGVWKIQGFQKIVLLHLHAAVKRAQLLVERCCCETSASWRVAAMTSTDIKEEVITIVLNIHQWTFVLDIAIASFEGGPSKENLEFLKTGEEIYQRLYKKLHLSKHPLQVAALQDQKTLLENIAEYTENNYANGVYWKSRLAPVSGEVQSVPQLKDFKVLRALGQGASGMVLEVTWMGHQCGLKFLKGSDKTEATILDWFHHPNIVRFFHYWEAPPPDCNSYKFATKI